MSGKPKRKPTEEGNLAAAMRHRDLTVSSAVLAAINPPQKSARRLRLRGKPTSRGEMK